MSAPVTMLRIMPREMRMMSERILSLTALPKGFVLAETDIVMMSQGLDLGGFALLEDRFELLRQADPAALNIGAEDGPALDLDCAGQHAWIAVPTLLDLADELVARFGSARIRVAGAIDASELAIAVPLGRRRGLAAEIAGTDAPVLVASRLPVTGDLAIDEPLLARLLDKGTPVEAELWWRVYEHAQQALTPDSIVSRRHAGPLIVTDDGTVIGRRDNDDETDIGFLAAPGGGTESGRHTP